MKNQLNRRQAAMFGIATAMNPRLVAAIERVAFGYKQATKRAKQLDQHVNEELDKLGVPLAKYQLDKEGTTHVCMGFESKAHPIKGHADYMEMQLAGGAIPLDALVANPASYITFDGEHYEHFINMKGKRFAELVGKHIFVEEVCVYKHSKYYQLKVLNKQLSN